MDNKLYEKFLEWIEDSDIKSYMPILVEDDETWHRMIWVVVYTKKDCVKIQVVRVFTADEVNISLSIDLEREYKCTLNDIQNSFLDAIVDVIETYKKIK